MEELISLAIYLLRSIGVPALAFSLGMFIPLQLNTPLLLGGIIAHIVGSRSKDEKLRSERPEEIQRATERSAGGRLEDLAALARGKRGGG